MDILEHSQIKVLFVCLGNICRSPLGEGIFKHLVEEKNIEDNFFIDSCGTGSWHQGGKADINSRRVAKQNGLSIEDQISRQIIEEDLIKFDYIIAMDKSNYANILKLGEVKGTLKLMREYDPIKSDNNVPDPYGMAGDSFSEVYDIVYRSCENLLDEILKKHNF